MVFGLLALLVQSCTKDLGEAPEVQPRAGLTIRLTVPQGVQRGQSAPTYAGTEPGYGAENSIEALYITFYSRNIKEQGSAALWSKVREVALTGKDVPDFSGTSAAGNPSSEIRIENIPVTYAALNGGTELKVVIYANSKEAPGAIAAESDFWSGTGVDQELKPLFFSGEAIFEGKDTKWMASVRLTRQVAKLRVKVGLHKDAVPASLVIAPNSISVDVKHMADRSSTMEDPSRDPGFVWNPSQVKYIDRTGQTPRLAPDWKMGMVADSIYMHSHGGSEEADATVVTVKMNVSDPVAGVRKELTLEYPLAKALAEGGKDYTIRRNTIYTLDVQVQSIEGESVSADLDIQEWDAVPVDVDVPWGELRIDKEVLYGSKDNPGLVTLSAGQGKSVYEVCLVKADKKSVINNPDRQNLQYDNDRGSFEDAAEGVVTIASNSRKLLRVIDTDLQQVYGASYLRIRQLHGSDPAGITRFIPLGRTEFSVPEDFHVTYRGESVDKTIVSKSAMPDGSSKNLSWKIDYVDDLDRPGTSTDWLALHDTSGSGESLFRMEIGRQEGSTSYPHKENLETAPEVQDYDLSGGEQNTANCYVINAPGTYYFPLVYGNGIKNGQANTSAYRAVGSGTNTMQYVNHRNVPITSPWIWENERCTPHDVVLLWQDVDGLISRVWLTGEPGRESYRLHFEVPRATIDQGNAVVAVRDDRGNIMWSWHIWVTDYKLGEDLKTLTTYGGQTYQILPVNLGWCDGEETAYEERAASIRVVQSETGEVRTFTVRQDGGTVFRYGNCTYYQWGRKDPMLGAIRRNNDNDNDNDLLYDKSCYGDYKWKIDVSSPNGTNYINSILYPYAFYANNLNWCNGQFNNLWNNRSNPILWDGIPTKTIYDPSPVGYCMAPINIFTGMTSSGRDEADGYGTIFNMPYRYQEEVRANYGWEFYCRAMPGEGQWDESDGTYYIPNADARSYNGKLVNLEHSGYYWTGNAYYHRTERHYQQAYSTNLKYNSSAHNGKSLIVVRQNTGKGFACPVRSIKER